MTSMRRVRTPSTTPRARWLPGVLLVVGGLLGMHVLNCPGSMIGSMTESMTSHSALQRSLTTTGDVATNDGRVLAAAPIGAELVSAPAHLLPGPVGVLTALCMAMLAGSLLAAARTLRYRTRLRMRFTLPPPRLIAATSRTCSTSTMTGLSIQRC